MSAVSSAAAVPEKGPARCPSAAQAPPAARGMADWLSHGEPWPMARAALPARLCRAPRSAPGAAPAGGGRGRAGGSPRGDGVSV